MCEIENDEVFVCGAGHQGLSMAAHLSLNGYKVFLWNRTFANIKEIAKNKEIECNGIICGKAKIEKASDDIKEVIKKVIMVTTPSSAHKDIAIRLAPFVTEDMVIVLNPGRTFGAIEFAETLKAYGVKKLPHIAETQTIVYTCRKSSENSTTIFTLKKDVKIASINKNDIEFILNSIPSCIRSNFTPVDSIAYTSFMNVGMILHCAPVLMNIGWIEAENYSFKYYYDGITVSIADFLEKMDKERVEVAKAFGFNIETIEEWMKRSYLITGNNLFECIKNNIYYKEIDAPTSINTRYIFEDVPNGLVPLEKAGEISCIPTPMVTLVIDLANAIMNTDFRKTGRVFSKKLLKKYF